MVSGNIVRGNDAGAYNYGPADPTTFDGNRFTDNRDAALVLDEGTAVVTGNTITASAGVACAYGVLAFSYNGAGSDAVGNLTGNTISGMAVAGVNVQDDGTSHGCTARVTLNGDRLTGNAVGLQVQGGVASATGGTLFNGNGTGVEVTAVDAAVQPLATLTSCTITGNTLGVTVDGTAPSSFAGDLLAAHFDRIVGNWTGVVNSSGGGADATDDWWGSNTGPGGAVSATVNASPWLVLGLSASPSTLDVSAAVPGRPAQP